VSQWLDLANIISQSQLMHQAPSHRKRHFGSGLALQASASLSLGWPTLNLEECHHICKTGVDSDKEAQYQSSRNYLETRSKS
jgi:hypothetical protein